MGRWTFFSFSVGNLPGKKSKLMSAEQLVDFLNKEQRDPRLNEILYPYANQAKGKEIINQYEPNASNRQQGEFFSHF